MCRIQSLGEVVRRTSCNVAYLYERTCKSPFKTRLTVKLLILSPAESLQKKQPGIRNIACLTFSLLYKVRTERWGLLGLGFIIEFVFSKLLTQRNIVSRVRIETFL